MADLPGLRRGGFKVSDGLWRVAARPARTRHAEADYAAFDAMRRTVEAVGLPVPRVVAGGTPTFPIHARHADRECSPGTCVFWDASYAGKFPDLDFIPAALVLTVAAPKPLSPMPSR